MWHDSARRGYKSEQYAEKETAFRGPTNCSGFFCCCFKETEEEYKYMSTDRVTKKSLNNVSLSVKIKSQDSWNSAGARFF